MLCSERRRFLNHDVFDSLEFRLPGKRQTLRQILFVGTQHFFPELVPEFVSRSNARILCKLIHNLIHDSFERRFEISILLFAGQEPEALCQIFHELLDAVVLHRSGMHLPNQFTKYCLGVRIQLIPALRLFLIEFCQILAEDLFCQSRLDVSNALLGQKAF